MRYYIISDIHGNLEGLERALQDIESDLPGEVICLGDVVGYGPDPNECCRVIKEKASVTILGNHDESVIEDVDLSYFNPFAREAILWTKQSLTEESLDFLRSLPLMHNTEHACFVHATPLQPEEWNYIFNFEEALANFRMIQQKVCFIGHSHQPMLLGYDGRQIIIHKSNTLEPKDSLKYIINVGSVGQPRDGDPRLSYAVYDSDSKSCQIRRLAYDIQKTQDKMRKAGLNEFLIERLSIGR